MLKIHLLAAMLLFDLALIHIHDFPQVAVRILEAPSVHKAMIHRIIGRRPSCGKCGIDDFVHLLPAFGG